MFGPQDLANLYVSIWNEADAASRRSAISALWAPEGAHYAKGREARGYEALEQRITGSYEKSVRANLNRFRADTNAQALHNSVTFNWEMVPAAGDAALARGLEFLVLDEGGRILADYQFIVFSR